MSGTRDLTFVRGDDWSHTITFLDDSTGDPLNWSGRTFTAQLRHSENDAVAVDWTVDGSGLASGVLVLTVAAADTADLSGTYVWDLQMTVSGAVTTLFAGSLVKSVLDVTRG